MQRKRGAGRGFSLVELLAVVLIIGVLAAIAIPLYINTRKTAAARSCRGNIAAIAAAESAYALRNGQYGSMANLLGAIETFTEEPKCPLNGSSYTFAPAAPVAGGPVTITCPNAAAHAAVLSSPLGAGDWSKTRQAPATDTGTL